VAHPHILVNADEKAIVLDKIKNYSWALTVFENMQKNVEPYVQRHVADREWILSRYLMNRVPGKRYTRVYSDNQGLSVIRQEGDAPVPTVRVSSHIRVPVTPSGFSYRRPSVEELIPYDTSRLMYLTNLETNKKEWVDPQAFVGDINGEINNLALNSAIIYWLTGDEKYAKFTSDILDQWARGAYYQEPVVGPCRTGFLDLQTLGDAAYRSLILAYDFVYPFMTKSGYDLKYYEVVFEKIASTLAFRGFWNNNWYAAESSTLVFAALSLENEDKKNYYLSFFLEKDTINGSCGQLALPSTVEKWLTPDGHWKEPAGYHNYPVSNLLLSALAMENNGYDIFRKFPALFKSSYVMLKYSFPNLTVSAFGDTGRASQSPELLEIGIIGALKYNRPELPDLLAALKKLTESGRYKRENSGYTGLLCYVPEIPGIASEYTWPRSGNLEFARYYLQRNGTDPLYGLMYGVQGASYNHNHCNGMAMELYGMGEVMGIDAGPGPTYEHPLHVYYYSQWAAHNTVVAAGSSSSVPFSGSAGRKDIGQIELAAMEPLPEKEAVSAVCSFTDTRYFDRSTGTNQMRTMAIIRTSEKSGYYVDIYRSDNQISNDYIYHNIGDTLIFLNSDRQPVKPVDSNYPVTEKDYPGFRFFKSVRKIENYNRNLIALFAGKNEKQEDIFMQVHLAGTPGRKYYQARSLRTRTAGRQYSGKDLPLFTMRDESESSTKPFVAVFEPFMKNTGYSVDSIRVEKNSLPGKSTSLWVFNNNGTSQLILQSVDPELNVKNENYVFRGYFGVAGLKLKHLEYLYLGKGTEISYAGFSLLSKAGEGSANLIVNNNNEYIVTCNQPVDIIFPFSDIKQATLYDKNLSKKLRVIVHGKGILISLPAVRDARLLLSTEKDSGGATEWKKLKTVSDVFRVYPERLKTLVESLNLDYPGLEKVKKAYSKNNIQKACEYLLEYYLTGSSATYLRRELPPSSERTEPQADSVVKNIFTFYNQSFVVPRDVEGHIDWSCRGPANDIEWAWALNRHYHINTLLDAYFRTGNRIYAKVIDEHIKDWITSSLPYPGIKSSTEMWRGLEVSFRVKAWSRVFYGLMKSNLLSPATRILLLSSLPEHAHYARNFHSQGNWLTMELSGLATVATAWPEFKNSQEWMKYSLKTMSESLEEQVYPDGVQTELTSSYHLVALNNFSLFMDICKQANITVLESYREKIEKMWNYLAWTMKPDGFGLLNNDADLIYFRDMIIKAADEFQRNDWLYIATNGEKGSKPESCPSVMFPWAGHMIMRSGFDRDAHFAFFDVGPWGTGHQHNDKLHLSVSASGKDFLVDAGRFAYRGEVADRFRRYATGSLSHNVVIPDGKTQNSGPLKSIEPVSEKNYAITEKYDFASGSFDRYTGLEGTFIHNRSVLYVRGKFWVVLDHFNTDRPRTIETLWHFHPRCNITDNGVYLSAEVDGAVLKILPVSDNTLLTRIIKGQLVPFPQGWYSEEYNRFEASAVAVFAKEIKENTNIIWIIFPSGKKDDRISARITDEGINGVKLGVTVSSDKTENYKLFIPFYDAALTVVEKARE